MKISFFRITFLFLSAFCILPAPLFAKDQPSGVLKIGIYDNPPKVFLDTEKRPRGIFPGIIEYIARQEGWRISFVPVTFKQGLKNLETGSIDIMQDVAWSPQRAARYGFTQETVMVSWGRVFKAKGTKIDTLIDLNKKRIAVMDGGIYSSGPDGLISLMKKFELKAHFIPVKGYKEVLQSIDQGLADAGVVNRLYGKKNRDKYNLDPTPILISPISIRFAFSKQNPIFTELSRTIDTHLNRMKQDETSIYYELISQYIGAPSKTVPAFIKNLLWGLLGLVAFFAALSGISNWQIRKKTRLLEKKELALKESEKKFRTIFENLQDIYFSAAIPGTFNMISPSVEAILGYRPHELIGVPVKTIFTNTADSPPLLELVAKKGYVRDYEILCRKKDGQRIWLSINADICKDAQGTSQSICGMMRDITQRQKLHQETIKRRKLESTGILAEGIAHDFNNILLSVFNNISVAKRETGLNHPAHPLLEKAENSISKAEDLTEQLLIFARGGDPVIEAVSIDQIVSDAARFSLRGTNITIVVEQPEELWQANADKSQVSQVIANLVTNSRQAMPDGGTLRIQMENAALSENEYASLNLGVYVKITVSDDGCGIPEEHIEKIFDPYFTTREGAGGLGLSIVHSIILRHNGYIYVNSTSDKGTAFVFYLPAAKTATNNGHPL